MRNLFRSRVLLTLALLTTAPLAFAAQEDPCGVFYAKEIKPSAQESAVWSMLNQQRQSGCILGPTDTTGIEDQYQQLFQSKPDTDKAVVRTQLFDAVLHEFDGLPSSVCEAPNDASCMVGRHLLKLRALREFLMEGSPDRADPLLAPNSWVPQVFNGQIAISQVGIQGFLQQECADGVASARCEAAVSLAAKLMRTSLATGQLIVAYNQPIIDANKRFLSQRDKEWDSYFNDVSVQYPWELGWNSARFAKAHKGELGSFPRAPSSKLVALHPSAGLERVDLPSGESGTLAAMVVELVGYESWRWRAGEAVNRWGVSLAASFADVPGMDAVGYGVLFHTPIRNISIGAVRRDGDAGSEVNLIINVDFAQMIQEYSQTDLVDFLTPAE